MAQNTQSRNDRFDGYIPVAERVEKFYERFPEGRIVTQIVEHVPDNGFVLMRAEVFRTPDDAQPAATGHAFEVRGESYVNKTSYIENAETSSVGRALALLGFEVKRGIASREEIEKVERMQPEKNQAPARVAAPARETIAPPAAAPSTPAPPAAEPSTDIDAQILQSAGELGYDAAKVRKWVNQKFEVTGGLGSLTEVDKKEVLRIFREQARTAQAKSARK
ncbi:MAG TPA: hypothetical protein VM934_01040 [Pyrinomonadaceae bacterium]|nr:hypothetical protein [Pyrinomonadaceae bacterium]